MGDVRESGEWEIGDDPLSAALAASGTRVWLWDAVAQELTWTRVDLGPDGPVVQSDVYRDVVDRVHPADRQGLLSAFEHCLRTGSPYVQELRFIRGDGEVVWLHSRGRPFPDENGNLTRMLGISFDTTVLRNARERAVRTLEHVSDGLFIIEPSLKVVFVNSSASRLLDKNPEEIIGENLRDLLGEAEVEGFAGIIQRCMDEKIEVSSDGYFERLGGWFELRAFPGPDAITLNVRDVNLRIEAEQERLALIVKLELSVERAERLQSLTAALGDAMSPQRVCDVIVAHAGHLFGSGFASTVIYDEAGTVRALRLGPLPYSVSRLLARIPPGAPSPGQDALQAQEPIFHASPKDAEPGYSQLASAMQSSGWSSAAHLPLISGMRPVGVLSLYWQEPTTFGDEERRFFATVASQCAQAVERAELFEQQHQVAISLQQAILPDRLPTLPGVELAARYLPADTESGVGGDWYDAFCAPDGHLWIAVGDVSGHGLAAASVMGQLRNAMRMAAYLGLGPAAVVDSLDNLLAGTSDDLFATMVVGRIEPGSGTMTWSSGGHPPVLIIPKAASPFFLDKVQGSLLGLRGRHEESELVLLPGSCVVLFTDGLVEQRRVSIEEGMSKLLQAMPEPSSPDVLASRALTVALSAAERPDDLCLLVARYKGLDTATLPSANSTLS